MLSGVRNQQMALIEPVSQISAYVTYCTPQGKVIGKNTSETMIKSTYIKDNTFNVIISPHKARNT